MPQQVPWKSLASGVQRLEKHLRGEFGPSYQATRLAQLQKKPIRPGMSAALLQELQAEMPQASRGRWKDLEDAEARAVVTGQQPGCLGGPLLVLYKAATAVQLARRLASRWKVPVVPIFWNAADDTDFAEISRVGWPSPENGLWFLEFDTALHQPETFVGDLPARANTDLLETLVRRGVEGWEPSTRTATNHGDWVRGWLEAVFPEIAVVDGRSGVLRKHAAGLFLRYLEEAESVRRQVQERQGELGRWGLKPILSGESLRTGLFLTPSGRRQKTREDWQPLRQAARQRPQDISPNVLLRPLVQDLLLPTVAQVVGPSELGYLMETQPLRPLLEVPEMVWVPRLSATLVPRDVAEEFEQNALDPAQFITDPEVTLAGLIRKRAFESLQEVDELTRGLSQAYDDFAKRHQMPRSPKISKAVERLQGLWHQQITARERQLVLEAFPALRTAGERLRPRGKLQERQLAAAWLWTQWRDSTNGRLGSLASTHLDSLEKGDVPHSLCPL